MAAAALMTATMAGAAGPRPVVQAVWVAQSGTTMFHGNVSAQALPTSGNALVGSWTLANEDWAVMMQGTWSGKKSARGWTGTWQAQVATGAAPSTERGRPSRRPASKARLSRISSARSATFQISGYWKSRGGTSGAWWLKPRLLRPS